MKKRMTEVEIENLSELRLDIFVLEVEVFQEKALRELSAMVGFGVINQNQTRTVVNALSEITEVLNYANHSDTVRDSKIESVKREFRKMYEVFKEIK